MVQLFIKDVLKSDGMPIGEIVVSFYRVKFQQECLILLKEFTLQNPLKRNVSTTYSQFPLIHFHIHLPSKLIAIFLMITRL